MSEKKRAQNETVADRSQNVLIQSKKSPILICNRCVPGENDRILRAIAEDLGVIFEVSGSE